MLFKQRGFGIHVVRARQGPSRVGTDGAGVTKVRSRSRARRTPPGKADGGRRVRLAGRDLDVDGRADLGVQPDPHLVRADGLDRVADLDPAPVELGAARLAYGGGNVRRA